MLSALLIALWAFLCGIDKYDVALAIHRPIITGPVVGFILGDPTLGIVTGATLELAWLGLVPNAGAQPPDVTLGTIAAVVFQVHAHQAGGNISADSALGVGLPIAVIMQLLIVLFFTATSFTMNLADRRAEEANPRALDRYLIVTVCLRGLLYAVIAFLTAISGQALAEFITNNVPKVWLEGIGIGAKMVPAIGFALLLKTMWSKNVAPWFFVGFVATTYMKLPIMAVAILSGCIAALIFFASGNSTKQQAVEFEDGI